MGGFVDGLGGRYIIARGFRHLGREMEIARRATRHGRGHAEGAPGSLAATAWGVLHGMRAAARHRLGRAALQGLTVAVQGLGAVGLPPVAGCLAGGRARLIVSDIVAGAVARAVADSARRRSRRRDIRGRGHIFAPCALGRGSRRRDHPAAQGGDRSRARPTTSSPRRSTRAAPPAGASSTRPTTSSRRRHHQHLLRGAGYDRDTAFRHVARIHDTPSPCSSGPMPRASRRASRPTASPSSVSRRRRAAPA